jgi:hypothetical protein
LNVSIKRAPGQTKSGAEYTEKLRVQKRRRTHGLHSAMKVHKFIVLPVLEEGDWHPQKRVCW